MRTKLSERNFNEGDFKYPLWDNTAQPYVSDANGDYLIDKSLGKKRGNELGDDITILDKLKKDLVTSGSAPTTLLETPTILRHWIQSAYGPSFPIIQNSEIFSMDPKQSDLNSHEIGHFLDYTGKPKRVISRSLQRFIPGWGPIRFLLDEQNANKNSWEALKKTYKNDPELLEKFKQVRSESLPKAFSTYLNMFVPMAAGSVGGGAMGVYYAHKKNKKDEEEYNNLINSEEFKNLSEEAQKKILRSPKWKHKNRGFIGKRLRELKYGLGGSIAGEIAGIIPGAFLNYKASDKIFKHFNSDKRKKDIAELNKLIQSYDPAVVKSYTSKTTSSKPKLLQSLLASFGGYADELGDKPKTSILNSLKGTWNSIKSKATNKKK